jgi:hypothetical protein
MFKAVVQMLLPALLAICLVAPVAAQITDTVTLTDTDTVTDTSTVTDTAPITDSVTPTDTTPLTDTTPSDSGSDAAAPGSQQAPLAPNTGAAIPSGMYIAGWGLVAVGLIAGGMWLQRRSNTR